MSISPNNSILFSPSTYTFHHIVFFDQVYSGTALKSNKEKIGNFHNINVIISQVGRSHLEG